MEATLYEKIAEKRESILSLWQAAVLPQDAGFGSKATAKTRFAVPTDDLLKEETTLLFNWLISEEEPAMTRTHLTEICKVKAVMTQGPSEALGFILDLKGIIQLVLASGTGSGSGSGTGDGTGTDSTPDVQKGELEKLNKRIDRLLLLAFDEYMDCRERIMEIKLNEVQRLAGRTVQ